MPLEDFILAVFCLVDDFLQKLELSFLRRSGPAPTLSDSEVITMEVVGEFLRMDTDKHLFAYFRQHHRSLFPRLPDLHRTTLVRQAANLWKVKERVQEELARQLASGTAYWLVDSFPLDVCLFARANRCQLFQGQAAYGFDHSRRQTFYGFRVHVRSTGDGVILKMALAPANEPEIDLIPELEPLTGSIGIGDRAFWSPEKQAVLENGGVKLLAPFRQKSNDPDPQRSKLLSKARWMVETIIGQLAERFQCKLTWARDLWHLANRLARKVLSHTIAIWLNIQQRSRPLAFEKLLIM